MWPVLVLLLTLLYQEKDEKITKKLLTHARRQVKTIYPIFLSNIVLNISPGESDHMTRLADTKI